jgi:hypothetical protein
MSPINFFLEEIQGKTQFFAPFYGTLSNFWLSVFPAGSQQGFFPCQIMPDDFFTLIDYDW